MFLNILWLSISLFLFFFPQTNPPTPSLQLPPFLQANVQTLPPTNNKHRNSNQHHYSFHLYQSRRRISHAIRSRSAPTKSMMVWTDKHDFMERLAVTVRSTSRWVAGRGGERGVLVICSASRYWLLWIAVVTRGLRSILGFY